MRYVRERGYPAVIHLDLHPENVLLHGRGALVIDWANARERELIPLVRV